MFHSLQKFYIALYVILLLRKVPEAGESGWGGWGGWEGSGLRDYLSASTLRERKPDLKTLFQVSASFRVSALYFLLAINTKEGLRTNAQYFLLASCVYKYYA